MVATAVFAAAGGVVGLFFLDETLKRSESSKTEGTKSARQLLSTHVTLILCNLFMVSLIGVSLLALLPLFCFTPIQEGGLGMNPQEIGYWVSGRFITSMLAQLLLFPGLQRRFGTVRVYKWSNALWVPSFVALPLAQVFARAGSALGVNLCLAASLIIAAIAGMSLGKCAQSRRLADQPSVQLSTDKRGGSYTGTTGYNQW